ncbi:Lnb N-terminal periplasmic domain-containing protein [Azorhizobium oxalatiphilum]|uniref:Lnb N-terminal periplasmic domain-containing protein n=1 Tax=Azorhizobium oxalatiphilum TaxID=980631 RepID=UPI001FCEE8D0|nr:DUF4105 domain-containing protein [Azorhizobium oxalatiphilum]
MSDAIPRRPRLWSFLPLALLVVLAAAWTLTAVSFQVPGGWRWPVTALVGMAACGILYISWYRRLRGWLALFLGLVLVTVWWSSIQPSAERDWAPDVARIATAQIDGNRVTVHDVRNFDWRSETDFTPRWETRTYDLNGLQGVDLVTSVWANPAIAHTLVSFAFADGQHLVFSVEIRRERTEVFSEIGGFFKEFELAMIAADENDIVRLRTDARGETVSLFPLNVTPEQARKLFLSYLARTNALVDKPEFYQTITSNCTTVIFRLARLVAPGLPMDWRILLSGYVPDYLHDHGALRTSLSLDETKRAAVIHRKPGDASPAGTFSADIRAASPLYGAGVR